MIHKHLNIMTFMDEYTHLSTLQRYPNRSKLRGIKPLEIKMVQELMEMIPIYERERAMDKIVKTRPGNVIDGKFR